MKSVGWAKRNPENPANPVNPDSDKGARLPAPSHRFHIKVEEPEVPDYSPDWTFTLEIAGRVKMAADAVESAYEVHLPAHL